MSSFKSIQNSIEIRAGKAEVWDLLFNRFGEVNVFNPVIVGSHFTKGEVGAKGCERQCDLDEKNSVIERITDVHGTDSFDIDIIQGGLPMMEAMNASLALEALSANCTRVVFTANFVAKPSFMSIFLKGMLGKMIMQVLVGLKYHLETGHLVTKKNIDEILKQFKKIDSNGSFQLAA